MRLGCQRSWEPTMTGKMGYRLRNLFGTEEPKVGLGTNVLLLARDVLLGQMPLHRSVPCLALVIGYA
jgi:hypothetical protein